MTLEIPAYLRGPVGAMEIWSNQSQPTKFLVIRGPAGSGKRHWIDLVLHERGIRAVHRYDDLPCPPTTENGRPVIGIYHPDEPFAPPTTRSVVILDGAPTIDRKIIGEKGELAVVVDVPLPPRYVLEMFLERHGAPARLAEGNPTHAACRHAIRAWKFAGVEIRQVPNDPENWEGFRAGGAPPVEGALLGYYCGENLPKTYWTWNRALRMADRGRIPSKFIDLALDEIRKAWPSGTPRFPAVLVVPKPRKEDAKEHPAPRRNLPTETGAERSTPITWP